MVGASIPTLDNTLARIYEPHAPAPTRRLETLQAAKEAGLNVFAALAPTYPECDEADLRRTMTALAQIEPATLFMEPINIRAENVDRIAAHAQLVGRPVTFAGAKPDEALAKARYDAVFAQLGAEVHYVYEPMGAAFSYAERLADPATILVADFGGGTSDFSVVRIAAPGAGRRCEPLGHAGVGIAGDRFDRRIVEHLVMPMLGKGGTYRSFDKVLEIPGGYFADFADWSRLALMRNRKTLAELEKLRRTATDPEAIGRMIAVIEEEEGYHLYDAVGRLKRALSAAEAAEFRFEGAGLNIAAEVRRSDFEAWIAPDVARIDAAVDQALVAAGVAAEGIDRVFLTGGTSLTPRIRRLFATRFGEARLATGGELTSIAHGLALIGQQADVGVWAV